jgi:hypothetical protein
VTSHRIAAALVLAPIAFASCDPAPPASPATIAPRVVPAAAPPPPQEITTTATIYVSHPPPTPEFHSRPAPTEALPVASTPVQNADSVMNQRFFPMARACYQNGLREDPHQAGRLVVAFEIAPDGTVVSTIPLIVAGLLDTTTACIVAKGDALAFESNGLGSGASIIVPLNFVHDNDSPRSAWLTKATNLVALEAYGCIKSRTDECVGNMTLMVHIDASGVATDVHAEHGATASTPISMCVAEEVAKARFEAGVEATLSMPIVFRPPAPLPANDAH